MRPRTGFVLLVLLAALAGGCTGGCARVPAPAEGAVGRPIPIGAWAMTITGVRDAWETIVHVPIGADETGVVVMVDWSGLDDVDPMSRQQFLEAFHDHRLVLRDGRGRTHRPHSSGVAELYAAPGDASGAAWCDPTSPRGWAVWFVVPADAQDLSLVVEDPEPREGRPARTAVPLGR